MARARRPHWPTIRPAVPATLALIALSAVPAQADAAGASFFRSGGCDVSYRAERISTYSTAKTPAYRAAVRHWKFADLGGTILHPPASWGARKSRSLTSKIQQMKYLDRLFAVADERKLASTDPMSTADRKLALKRAVAIAIDWSKAANRGKLPEQIAWNPRVAAIRAPYLAYAARRGACAGLLGNGEADQLQRALDAHVPVLKAKPKKSTPQNHKLSIYSGAAMLASYFPHDRDLRSVADKAGSKLLGSLSGGYQQTEGVWLEHSPRYHRLAYEVLSGWLARVDPGADAIRRARDRLLSSLGRLVMPDDRLVTFGDTSGEVIQNGEILAARQDGWWVARRSGYAVFSDSDSWFGLTAQYHTRQHKQADELSFDLYDRGQRLIQDTGFFTKDRGPSFNYQRSAQAHSTLTVDNRSFDYKLHQKPYGSGIRESGTGDGWYAVRATNPLLVAPKGLSAAQRRHSNKFKRSVKAKLRKARRFDARHTRTYLYKPGEALIVADAVRSQRVHTYQRRFQFAPNVATVELLGGVGFLTGKVGGLMTTDSPGARAHLDLDGDSLVFPATGLRRTRTTATLSSRAKDLDQATGIFYGPSKVKSIAVKGGLADGAEIELRGPLGERLSTVTVIRSGEALSVSQNG